MATPLMSNPQEESLRSMHRAIQMPYLNGIRKPAAVDIGAKVCCFARRELNGADLRKKQLPQSEKPFVYCNLSNRLAAASLVSTKAQDSPGQHSTTQRKLSSYYS